MEQGIRIIGDIAALIGILVCLVAGAGRIAGQYHVFGFEAMTLFIGGTALMVFACLTKLHLIYHR
jgi:hypothetical protein